MLFAGGVMSLASCGDNTPVDPRVPRDSTAPRITVYLPTADRYDADGDALVDVQLDWADASGAVNPATARVRSLAGVNGPADGAANLLDHWRVIRRDSAGLTFSETVENLLHGGENALEISVADTAGNARTDTIHLSLPHAQYFKTIQSGLTINWWVERMVICPDDGRLYAAAGRNVLVIDVDSVKLLGIMTQSAPDAFRSLLCIPENAELWATAWLHRFDRRTWQALPEVVRASNSFGIARSRLDSNLVYVGESAGSIAVIDRAANRRVGVVYPFVIGSDEVSVDIAVLPGDSKLYATRSVRTGILVIDPKTGSELKLIRIGGPTWPDYGETDDIELSGDDRFLYAAVVDGDPRSLVEIDTQADEVVRTLPLADYLPVALGLSPSGRRMWVSTQDRWWPYGEPSSNVLVDVPSFQVIQRFPRPRPAGTLRLDSDAVFHPNGKYIFVGHDLNVDVYLNRE